MERSGLELCYMLRAALASGGNSVNDKYNEECEECMLSRNVEPMPTFRSVLTCPWYVVRYHKLPNCEV